MLNHINTLSYGRFIIFILVTLSLIACSEPDDRERIQTARNYLSDKKIREAALELKDALQNNPDNAEARYMLGKINLDIGDSAAAEKEFRRARKAGWQEEETQIGLARALIYAHKFQDLVDEIKIKENYSPTARANLYGLRAIAQASLGEMAQATEALAIGARIDANAFQLLKSTIQLRFSRGDLEGATSRLKQALSIYPNSQEILLLSAITSIGSDPASAKAAYQKVIHLDPPRLFTVYGRKARLGLVRLEILEKNLDQAESTLAPLIKRNGSDPETNYQAGLIAFSQGNYERAEDYLLKVLRMVPEHNQTQLLFGTVKYAQQDYEQAAHYIAKYLNTVPENLGARKLLGRTYMMLGQPNEALAALQVAMEGKREDAELLALVGLSQLQGGDMDSGIAGLEHALEINPENSGLRRELAKAYFSTGETDHAIEQLKTILAKEGSEEQTETLLVLAYLRTGSFDQAINTVLKILARNPDNPAVLTLAGNALTASHDKPEARKYFNQALRVSPGFFPATLSLASLEEQEGNIAKAVALYKGIIDTDEKSITPLLALARLAELQGKMEEMSDWLEQARAKDPSDIRPRAMLAKHYLREKQVKKAGSLVDEAIDVGSLSPSLIALKSKILIADKRYNEALKLLDEFVIRAPESAFARVLLSETYLKLGQTKEARNQLGITLKNQANYVPALILMVSVELQSNDDKQALEYARKIQKVKPGQSMGYELAGNIRMLRKEYAEAKVVYAQAWKIGPSAALAIKLAETAKRSGKLKEAEETLLAWLNDHPEDARPLQFLGTTYQDMGQADKAIQAYEKVLVVQPGNMVALNNLAWIYALTDNPKALSLAKRAYQASPDNAGIQDTYGWLLVQHGKVNKGRGLLKQAMEKLSGVAEVRYHYAVSLLKSGEKREARKRLKQLLQSKGSFEGKEAIKGLLGE